MKKWICAFIAATLAFGGALPVFSEEGDSGDVAPKLQKMEYVEGEALVKVAAPVQKSRTRLFAGGDFEVETLLDLSAFSGRQQEVTTRSNAAVLQNGFVSAQASSGGGSGTVKDTTEAEKDGNTVTEEKILLVKSDAMSTAELMETLEQRPEVEYAEPNYIFQFAALTNDTYIDRQWYVQKDSGEEKAESGSAKATTIWESSSTGNISPDDMPVVAVIDSGVDYEHPDLKNMLWDDGVGNCGVDFSDLGDLDGDGPMDYYGHGTHVAGIIGAQHNNNEGISGMSKSVKLMALKISDDYGNFDSASAVEAYNYMLEKKEEGVNIIAANNSWGGYYYSRILEEIIDVAGDNGIISVAASGNESIDHDTNLNSPEGGDRTTFLLVNASDEKGKAADFSDYGLIDTDLYAQGMNIFSTVRGKTPEDSGEETPGYGYMDGTSVAAPVVTGAVALLYDYYDAEGLNNVQQKEALKEIRARIAGGVARTEEMKDLCASGGYLNLEKAITSPYPVLDALEQNGSEAIIKGYFFGSTGTLEMDGKQVEVKSWSDRKIVFTLPDGTREGLHEFKITDKSKQEYGTTQYGRDKLWVEEVRETPSGDFFEALTPPDFDDLDVIHPVEEISYEMAACDGKLYVMQNGLHMEGEESLAILVYDVESEEWTVITAVDVKTGDDVSLELVTSDDGVYLVESSLHGSSTQLRVFKKTEEDIFELVGEVLDNDWSEGYSMTCDGRHIWIAGGQYLDRKTWKIAPDTRILRFDTKTGKWERTTFSLKAARYNAAAEVIDGKLIVIGGINADGQVERSTEIIDLKTGDVMMGASLPEVDETQEIGFATGVYDGKLLVSGLFGAEDGQADTYVYDWESDTWSPLKQRIIDTKMFLMDGAVSGEYFYVYGITLDGGSKKEVFRRLRLTEPPAEEEEVDDGEEPEDLRGDGEDDNRDVGEEERKKTNGKNSGSQTNERLNTGDTSDLLLWLTLMTTALTAAVGVVFLGSRRQKR